MFVLKIYSFLMILTLTIVLIVTADKSETDKERNSNIAGFIFLLPILIYILWS